MYLIINNRTFLNLVGRDFLWKRQEMIISSLFTIISIIDDFNIKLKFTKFLYKLFCIVIVKLTPLHFFWFHRTKRSKRGVRSSWSISQRHHIVKSSQEALYYITGRNFMVGGCRKFLSELHEILKLLPTLHLESIEVGKVGQVFQFRFWLWLNQNLSPSLGLLGSPRIKPARPHVGLPIKIYRVCTFLT